MFGAQVRQPQLVDHRGHGEVVVAAATARLVGTARASAGHHQGGADRRGQAQADEHLRPPGDARITARAGVGGQVRCSRAGRRGVLLARRWGRAGGRYGRRRRRRRRRGRWGRWWHRQRRGCPVLITTAWRGRFGCGRGRQSQLLAGKDQIRVGEPAAARLEFSLVQLEDLGPADAVAERARRDARQRVMDAALRCTHDHGLHCGRRDLGGTVNNCCSAGSAAGCRDRLDTWHSRVPCGGGRDDRAAAAGALGHPGGCGSEAAVAQQGCDEDADEDRGHGMHRPACVQLGPSQALQGCEGAVGDVDDERGPGDPAQARQHIQEERGGHGAEQHRLHLDPVGEVIGQGPADVVP